MQKFTLFISILLISAGLQAQKAWKGEPVTYTPDKIGFKTSQAELIGIQDRIKNPKFEIDVTKAVDCAVDTSLYPLFKAPSLGIEGLINLTNRFSSSLQRYQIANGGQATVHGFDFHAFFSFDSTNAAVISTVVDCNLFGVGNFGGPDRSNLLATVQVTVDTAGTNRSDGFLRLIDTRYSVSFATPVLVTDTFFLEVSNPSTTNFIGIFRSSIDVNGAGGGGNDAEDGWYTFVQDTGPITVPGTGITGTNGNNEPVTWDADNLLHPHIEFTIDPSFKLTGDATCLPHGEAAIFENTSSPMTGNKYFNVYSALAEINTQPDSAWRWIQDTAANPLVTNWGVRDYVTVFNAPLTQASVGLNAVELGYSRICQDFVSVTYPAGAPAVSDFGFTVDTNQTVVFTNNSTGDNFMWDFGDGNTSTDVLPTHTYATGGNYTVTLTASGAGLCSTTSSQEVGVATTDIMDDLLNSQVNIYPNPSNGLFTLDLNMDQLEEVRIDVKNMVGQRVVELAPMMMQSGEITLDMQHAESGIYLLTLKANDRQITRKLSLK